MRQCVCQIGWMRYLYTLGILNKDLSEGIVREVSRELSVVIAEFILKPVYHI